MSHPTIETAIARVKAVYSQWRRDTTVEQMRNDWDALFGTSSSTVPIVSIDANGVPCQWITAEGASDDRVVLYLHGGGFQVGSLYSHHELMAKISAASKARVLGVEYRLAPEHRYPAALQDALGVYHWLKAQNIKPEQIAIVGDSAGGGLGLALLLALQQSGQEHAAAAYWGLSPWTDLTASGPSYETRAGLDPIHQRAMVQAMAKAYLGRDGDASDPMASPLFAQPGQLAKLPPMLFQVGERETIVSDSELFVEKASMAGAQAKLQIWPNMIHVFQQFPDLLNEAVQALAEGGEFLATHFDLNTTRRIVP